MRLIAILPLLPLVLVACSDADSVSVSGGPGPASGAGGGAGGSVGSGGSDGASQPGNPLSFPDDDDFDEDATPDDALSTVITAPTQLVAEGGTIAAITADDRLVYTTPDGAFSVKAAAGAPPRKVASRSGDIYVKGRTVFTISDIDYETGLGDLTIWTPKVGRRSLGKIVFGVDRVAARRDDAHVMFMKDAGPALDVVIVSADKQHAQVLVDDAARAAEDTCGPSFGFAGDAAIVTWCEPGSTTATLARFVFDGEGWQRTDVSTTARGGWASDAAGANLFYIASTGEGMLTDLVNEQKIGEGVGSGVMHPDGSVLFFTVGDQLRRFDDTGAAVPVVVDGFSYDHAWSADLGTVLYSNETIFDGAAKQDLRATTTEWFNPQPTVLVSEPIAVFDRDIMTRDGAFALYLTDDGDEGGKLHIHPLAGGGPKTFLGVDTVVAAAGSLVLFTDNRSGPGVYPTVADLKLVDAAAPLAPVMLEAAIVDGRDIRVRSDGTVVGFRRDGDLETGGIWLRPLP